MATSKCVFLSLIVVILTSSFSLYSAARPLVEEKIIDKTNGGDSQKTIFNPLFPSFSIHGLPVFPVRIFRDVGSYRHSYLGRGFDSGFGRGQGRGPSDFHGEGSGGGQGWGIGRLGGGGGGQGWGSGGLGGGGGGHGWGSVSFGGGPGWGSIDFRGGGGGGGWGSGGFGGSGGGGGWGSGGLGGSGGGQGWGIGGSGGGQGWGSGGYGGGSGGGQGGGSGWGSGYGEGQGWAWGVDDGNHNLQAGDDFSVHPNVDKTFAAATPTQVQLLDSHHLDRSKKPDNHETVLLQTAPKIGIQTDSHNQDIAGEQINSRQTELEGLPKKGKRSGHNDHADKGDGHQNDGKKND